MTITVAPVSKLSSLKRLQAASTADSTSEIQSIVTDGINEIPLAEIGIVTAIDDYEATVELERMVGSSVKGRII